MTRFGFVIALAGGVALSLPGYAEETSATEVAAVETSAPATNAENTTASSAAVEPVTTEVKANDSRNPLTGLPTSLAALRNYRSMRVASDDRKGNADMRRIEPGATFTAAELQGPGEITHLWTTIASANENHLRDTVIRIYWDGNDYPSVESPIGDFYGLGHAKYYIFNNPVQAIGSDKGMNAFWPMPFAKSARVTITNESATPIDAYYYYVDWRKFDELPQNVGYFHAQYHQAFPCPDKTPYLILDTDGGAGHFAGVSLSIHTQVGGWWGEGDDIFTIDGEATPSLWGTGSEDYFCGAWCYRETFYNHYFGLPLRTKLTHDSDNYWNVYRLHLESPITFKQSLKMEIEHGASGFDNTRAVRNNDYTSVAYWYQATPRPLKSTLPPAAERISKFAPPVGAPGIHEFNYMQYSSGGGIEAESQTLASFSVEGRKWFNDDHLWVRNQKANQSFELTFETTASESGKAVLRVTKAPDYGKVAMSLDGEPLTEYDGYSKVVRPEIISLGKRSLAAGKHTITVVGQGKNSASKNTHWAVDYLRVGGTAPEVEAAAAAAKKSGEGSEERSGNATERPRRRSNTRRN
ncbi:MAG: glycoside hydrolase family 172 protein [Candidatus Sumerlaeaceae bacterium]